MGRAHRKIEKEWFLRIAFFNPLDGFGDHLGLVLGFLDMLDDLVLFDNGADVTGVGEAVEVVEAELIRAD